MSMLAAATRKLRGSVSDGSEESLATSECDSDAPRGSRHAAPLSPLVGGLLGRSYQCQPSHIPGMFRHRLMPGLSHLYGTPGKLHCCFAFCIFNDVCFN